VRDDTGRDAMLLARVPEEARARFGINHATIQLETRECAHTCTLRPAHVI
jgi:cobalt-zinc-cadmium efflux system protein